MRWYAISALFLLVVNCGKVGDPLPPFIRIPEAVKDLSAAQRGYDVVLTWANPGQNVDGSAATDLARVRILSSGSVFATVDVNGAGMQQSYAVPARPLLGVPRTFTVQVETAREKVSNVSNAVSITPVEVPGRVFGLGAVVDQRLITLHWEPPRENPELAEGYFVERTGGESAFMTTTRYQDPRFESGQTYTYEVTAARRINTSVIPGAGTERVIVTAVDKTPPQIPAGLDVVVSDTGAFLTWSLNPESDLAGYRIFRSESATGPFTPVHEGLHTTSAIFDPGYRPGLYYAVSAVDEFGNESGRSAPYRAP